jgi:hypothetical protein
MPTEYDLNVPSLDGQSEDDLASLRSAFSRLADYCDLKRTAMRHRKAGRIDRALTFEASADRVYQQLPPWARW